MEEGTARIIKGTDLLTKEINQRELKEHMKKNKLIGFPTETVYGLGGNSLNEISLKSIFEMKERPTSDPIISHVFNLSQAFEQLYDINIFEKYILYILNKHFWPGPLSIIAKAKKQLPLLLTANTQFCAVRLPNNSIAKEIIKICEFPIAAPSANKFQHISPTTAQHVYEEFKNKDILIYDDGQCEVGIESTVIKLVKYKNKKIKEKENEHNVIETKKTKEKEVTTDKEYEKEKEEVTTDKEYEKEKEEEFQKLKLGESNDQKLEDTKKEQSLIKKLNQYNSLLLLFDNINEKKEKNNYVYKQLLKYKNLYQYSIIIYRRGKYTKNEIENVLKTDELLKDIKVDLSQKIKFETLQNCNNIIENKYTESRTYVNGINDNDRNLNNGTENGKEIGIENSEKKEKKNLFNNVNKNCSTNSEKEIFITKENDEKKKSNNFVSPGMMLTHYSPSVCTYMVTFFNKDNNRNFKRNEKKEFYIKCKDCILLDIGGSISNYKNHFLKYINIYHDPQLSQTDHIKYTTKNFFLCLRNAERYAIELKGSSILISTVHLNSSSEEWLSLYDRIFRASSGKHLLFLCENEDVTLLCNS